MKSLKTQIEEATSSQEIESLLDKGSKYEFASPATRRRWGRAAEARKAEIGREKKNRKGN